MHQHQTGNISWRDKIFISIGEAAEILSRSSEWVRNRVGEGSIEGRRFMPGGPVVVTVASLLAFVEHQTERAHATADRTQVDFGRR
jgi:hypothetical protein